MPSTSHLRHEASFTPFDAPVTHSMHPSGLARPEKKRKMTITQTYFLAHTARGKLSHEAARGDHDLRLLVGHANLLDSLTVELQEAEREQDAWFEKTVAESRKPSAPKRVQFRDEVAAAEQDAAMAEDDDSDSDADSEASDSDDDVYADKAIPDVPSQLASRLHARSRSPPPLPSVDEEDDDEDFYDDVDMDNADLALARVPSHSASPPELVHDSDDSDDDMSGPDSPPAASETPASFGLPTDVKAKDFALTKPAIHTEDHAMLQAVVY